MRPPVVAYLGDETTVRSHTELQAQVTYDSPSGVQSRHEVARPAYLGLSNGGSVENIPDEPEHGTAFLDDFNQTLASKL